jgi:hypothetical protein
VAGGVVGVNENDGPGGRGDGAADAFRVDLPGVVVDERRGFEPDVIKCCEEVEEGVGGLGDNYFAAGIAE